MDKPFLESYGGQTTEELLSLQHTYRIDSLVSAFEQGLETKLAKEKREPDPYELIVLAVEAMEREVNNGGWEQFFLNSSVAYTPSIVSCLRAIGCSKTAQIASRAIGELSIEPPVTVSAIESALAGASDKVSERLGEADDLYYENDEEIAEALFQYIVENKDKIRLP